MDEKTYIAYAELDVRASASTQEEANAKLDAALEALSNLGMEFRCH